MSFLRNFGLNKTGANKDKNDKENESMDVRRRDHERKEKKKTQEKEREEEKEEGGQLVPGTVLKFTVNTSIKKKKLKNELQDIRIAHLDFQDAQNQGFVRVFSPADAKALIKKYPENNDIKIKLEILSGDEEKSYFDKITQKRQLAKQRKEQVKQNKDNEMNDDNSEKNKKKKPSRKKEFKMKKEEGSDAAPTRIVGVKKEDSKAHSYCV